MAIFKCKMCGGDLDVSAGSSVAECEYCGTKQTVSTSRDEVLQNLFNRANNLRIKSEFDKAEQIYEKILNEDDTDAEAHWGIVLCKYGIEYVEDPKTYERIPTCHRTSYEAVTADADYLAAVKYADITQKAIYEREARAIDEIQKNILSIVKNEKPFDVFICYKETDENAQRTQDSVIANDIYYQLTQEGLKVFYAAITLEDKLGQAYEPYIFSALSSAKVMLVIGTRPEYFGAVWVKNEWSRFLKLMKTDRSKLLIPCYRDMDAYDLPEEFAHLQAQDMSKIGFITDITRGIKKIVETDDPKVNVKEPLVANAATLSTAPLLRRMFIFLEDGEFQRADEFCENILNLEPECAEAYLGKLMIELEVRVRDNLKDYHEPFDDNDNYRKIIRFADENLKSEVIGYIESINVRNENKRLASQYESIVMAMEVASTEQEYSSVAERFAQMGNYLDAAILSKECFEKSEVARLKALEKAKDAIYANACQLKSKNTIYDLEQAITKLKCITDWRDTNELIRECEKRVTEIKEEQERRRLERERHEELIRIENQKRIQRNKKIFKIATPAIIGVITCILLAVFFIIPMIRFNGALSLMEEGKYDEARIVLLELDGFGSSENKLAILDAIDTIDNGKYDAAIKKVLSASEPMNVKYNLNGGESSYGDNFSYVARSDYSSLIVPQKEGYRFVEWKLSEYSYSQDNSLQLVLDAIWSDGYLIKYKLNGGIATNPFEYHKDGDAITLNNPTKNGYTFVGWTGTDLPQPMMDVTISDGSYGDREYIANWQANEYIFTFDANGGTVDSSSISAKYDSVYTLPMPTKEHYTFAGWYDGTKKYEDGAWNQASNVTLTAKWTPISYTITYNLLGGTNSPQNVNNFTVESSKISLKDPTRTGYKFVGWYKDSSYSDKVTEIPAGSHQNISLHAKWQIVTYTITYKLNGGKISGTNKTTFTVNDLPLSLPTPTRTNYVFLGWKNESTGLDISSITTCENKTVSASYLDVYLQLSLVSPTYSWEGTEKYYKVTKYSGTATTVDIPAYYEGYPIREIGDNAFSEKTKITAINIPNTVKSIGYSAFENCSSLKSITIPSNVTDIEFNTFQGCSSLISVTIPDTVKFIGTSAFADCTSLVSVQLPGKLSTLHAYAFENCSKLTSINIPGTVKTLEYKTFYGCTSLSTVTLNEGLVSISFNVFTSTKIKKLIIPKSVTSIDAEAFEGYYSYYGGSVPNCTNITFYCRSATMPSGWEDGWNLGRPVTWGYTGN